MKQISAAEFSADVKNGMNREELMKKYELNPTALKKLAKQLNLTIKRTVKPKYELIMDIESTTVESTLNA